MALTKLQAAGIATGAVGTTKLEDDAVSNAKLTSSGTPANRAVGADTVQDDAIGIAALSATGTASSSTFLRGDNSWATPADTNTQLTEEQVEDFVGGMVTGNTETGITVTYEDSDGTLDFVVDDTSKLPLAGGTITGDVVFDNATNAGNDLTWDMSDNALEFTDTTKAVFGNSNDLTIQHDGSISKIVDTSGNLHIGTNSFILKRQGLDETILTGTANGAVELYYDDSKKLETASDKINFYAHAKVNADNTYDLGAGGARWKDLYISNDIDIKDNGKILLGDDDDLQLFHTSGNSHIENSTGYLHLKSDSIALGAKSVGENLLIASANGAVELFYDSSKKIETTSAGVTITGDLTVTGSAPGGGLTSDAQNNTVGGTNAGDSFTGTDANGNTLIGKNAGTAITSADYNVAIGADCMEANQTGSSNVAIGWEAMHGGTSGNNVAVGYKALHATGGQNSIGIGHSAGLLNTSDNNVFIGSFAGDANTSGSSNTAVGKDALSAVSTNGTNTAVGAAAAQNITGPGNTCVGASTFNTSNTGSNNVMMGYLTGQYKTGASNSNVAVGAYSFRGGDEGTQNTCLGTSSGSVISTGDDNVCVGQAAGSYITTGSNNIFIGAGTGMLGSPTGVYNTDSNTLSLGNNAIDDFYCADTSISSSDKRDKTDIAEWTHGLDWINKLKPVTYRWDKRAYYSADYSITPDGTKKRERQHLGFLAQDVLEVEQSFGYAGKKADMLTVNLNCDDTSYGMKYERLVVVLTKAVQELSAKNDALEARIATLEAA